MKHTEGNLILPLALKTDFYTPSPTLTQESRVDSPLNKAEVRFGI